MYIHQHICINENMYPPTSNFCPSILALSADRASAVALYLHKYIYTCVRTYIYVCMIYAHTPTSNFCSSNLALSSARACAVALELLSSSAASISVWLCPLVCASTTSARALSEVSLSWFTIRAGSVQMCVCVCVCVCVYRRKAGGKRDREREREREYACSHKASAQARGRDRVCVWEREGERGGEKKRQNVCEIEKEGEKEREREIVEWAGKTERDRGR